MHPNDFKTLIDVLQLLVAAFGGGFAIFLYYRSLNEKRQRFIFNIYQRLYEDSEIREILYVTDKNSKALNKIQKKLEEKSTETVKLEKELDKTLRYFDYIGGLRKNGYLKKNDLRTFHYEFKEILTNPIVVNYIDHLKKLDVSFVGLRELEDYVTEKSKS